MPIQSETYDIDAAELSDSDEYSVEQSAQERPRLPVVLFRGFLTLMFLGLIGLIPFVLRTSDAPILITLALATFIVVAAPVFLWKDYDLGEPYTLVVLMSVFGISFKVFYVLRLFGRTSYVDETLMNGESPSVLIYGSLVVAVGLICFIAGYWRRRSISAARFFPLARFDHWSEFRLGVVSVPLLIVSGLFFVLFAKSTGANLFSLESFSQKRFIDVQDQSSLSNYREEALQSVSYYYYRIAAFSKFAFYLNLAWMMYSGKRLMSWSGFLTAWAGLQTLAVFMFMNSRASVALVVLDAVVITYFLKDRISLWKLVAVGAFGGVLILVQLATRAREELSTMSLVEKTVAGRDFMDVTKMSLIINAVPHTLEYCYGETLVGWLAAPIPARIWPKKPLWSERGVHINQVIYGSETTVTGVTLGFISELYWNFSWLGVVVGMFALGSCLRILYRTFLPFRTNVTAVLIYSLIMTRMTLFILGADLGTGVLKTVLDLIPIAVLIIMVASSSRDTTSIEASQSP